MPPQLPGSNPGPMGPPSYPRISQPQPRPLPPPLRLSQPLTSNPLSPTGALRARRQTEAGQQATSELSVLTEQLLELPMRLRQAGLAAQKGRQLQEAMEAFTELAALAWSGLADGQLNEIAAQPLYRQRAVAATRRVSRLQQDTATSHPINEGTWDTPTLVALDRSVNRTGPLWRFRTRLYHIALTTWRTALTTERAGAASAANVGTALEDLRAAVGFAGMGTAHIILWRLLIFFATFFSGLIAAVAIGVAASTLTLGLWSTAGTLTTVAVLMTLLWSYLLGFLIIGRTNARFIMGAVRWRLIERERHTSQGLLAGWNWVTTILALAAAIGTLGGAAWFIHQTLLPGGALSTFTDLPSTLQHATGLPLRIVVSAVGILLALPILVALPSLLIYQGMLGRELAKNSARAPQVRRTALGTALPLFAFHTLLVLTVVLAVVHQVAPLTQPLASWQRFQISWVTPFVAVTILLVYVVTIATPYRNGVRQWRQARLGGIQTQKRELSAKLDRLTDGSNMTEEVTTVQYDVARLQYLKLQEDEFGKASSTAFGVWEQIGALMIVLITALLVDNGLAWATQYFIWR